MKKTIQTMIAASALIGWSVSALAQSPYVAAYQALGEQPNFSPASSEVASIVAAIEQQSVISGAEAAVIYRYTMAIGGEPAWTAAAERLGEKSPRAMARIKWLARDASGWTTEMIKQGNWDAVQTALFVPSAPEAFKSAVFASIDGRLLDGPTPKKFFKEYRSTLPKAEQVLVTQKQKDLLLAKVNRTEDEDAWLAEVSADLLALELDEQ